MREEAKTLKTIVTQLQPLMPIEPKCPLPQPPPQMSGSTRVAAQVPPRPPPPPPPPCFGPELPSFTGNPCPAAHPRPWAMPTVYFAWTAVEEYYEPWW